MGTLSEILARAYGNVQSKQFPELKPFGKLKSLPGRIGPDAELMAHIHEYVAISMLVWNYERYAVDFVAYESSTGTNRPAKPVRPKAARAITSVGGISR